MELAKEYKQIIADHELQKKVQRDRVLYEGNQISQEVHGL